MHSRTVRTAAVSLVSRDFFSSGDALRRERVDFACWIWRKKTGSAGRGGGGEDGKKKVTDRASLDR
jgi:hypothetical protein